MVFDEFAGVIAVPARVPTRFFGEEILPPWLESTPAAKIPLAMVRFCSHTLPYGGHCCPGVSRPVTADDSSFSYSGPISSSLFPKVKYTTDGGSGLGEMGLQCCTVSSRVIAVTYAASRSRFSTSRLMVAYFSAVNLSIALKSLLTFWRGIEIASLNAFTSDHKPA